MSRLRSVKAIVATQAAIALINTIFLEIYMRGTFHHDAELRAAVSFLLVVGMFPILLAPLITAIISPHDQRRRYVKLSLTISAIQFVLDCMLTRPN